MTNRPCRYDDEVDEIEKRKNRHKFGVRAKVEHPFLILKRVFGCANVRYQGLAKNEDRLNVACALVNQSVHAATVAAVPDRITVAGAVSPETAIDQSWESEWGLMSAKLHFRRLVHPPLTDLTYQYALSID